MTVATPLVVCSKLHIGEGPHTISAIVTSSNFALERTPRQVALWTIFEMMREFR